MSEERRRPGRPATGLTPQLNVRVLKTVQDAARAKAEQRGEKFADVVTRLLRQYTEQPD
ncbi:hypothetical protein GA0070616_4340 [Micromonospora nigra]|uniref:Uncharacterized protein n=1 Tax=Micromonospora nigra TaxID=145857 RepID=A0A1C6SR54_9ACTN|nr:hypothetical protein [Micromonospora nigra]SCL31832.1 hypothetical protein GA0070616_4340 [Micromonospora nigra]